MSTPNANGNVVRKLQNLPKVPVLTSKNRVAGKDKEKPVGIPPKHPPVVGREFGQGKKE